MDLSNRDFKGKIFNLVMLLISLVIATDLYIEYSVIAVSFISFFLMFFTFQMHEYINRTLSYKLNHIALITIGLMSIWLLRTGPNVRAYQIIISILISTVVLAISNNMTKRIIRYAIEKESMYYIKVVSMLEDVNIITAAISILVAILQMYIEVVKA